MKNVLNLKGVFSLKRALGNAPNLIRYEGKLFSRRESQYRGATEFANVGEFGLFRFSRGASPHTHLMHHLHQRLRILHRRLL